MLQWSAVKQLRWLRWSAETLTGSKLSRLRSDGFLFHYLKRSYLDNNKKHKLNSNSTDICVSSCWGQCWSSFPTGGAVDLLMRAKSYKEIKRTDCVCNEAKKHKIKRTKSKLSRLTLNGWMIVKMMNCHSTTPLLFLFHKHRCVCLTSSRYICMTFMHHCSSEFKFLCLRESELFSCTHTENCTRMMLPITLIVMLGFLSQGERFGKCLVQISSILSPFILLIVVLF